MDSVVQNELRRKAAHFSGVLWVLASYYLTVGQTMIVLLIFLFLSIISASSYRQKIRIPVLNNITDYLYSIARENEQKLGLHLGAIYFFASLALVLFITQDLEIFRIAALVLIVGDGMAGIFGVIYGKTKLPWNSNKTLEGSIAGFIGAAIAVSFILPINYAFLAAFAGIVTETIGWKLNDNLTIPLGVGLVLWLLM